MGRLVECPKCGADISDSYEPADPSVGIMGSGYYCDECEVAVAADFDDDLEYE